jgi:hypothetical protein
MDTWKHFVQSDVFVQLRRVLIVKEHHFVGGHCPSSITPVASTGIINTDDVFGGEQSSSKSSFAPK